MLTITPISFSGIRTLPQAQTTRVTLPQLKQDTFQKSLSFTGRTNFETWMLQNDITFNDIQAILSDDRNVLGQGNYSTAYQIPNCDEYCLKINTLDKHDLRSIDFSKARVQNTEDKNLKINIGQQVAKILIDREYLPIPYEVEIVKKQLGESIGVPHPESIVSGEYNFVAREGQASYEDYSRKEKYARTIHQVAQLPVESYEKLIQEFLEAKEAGYCFDYLNSNNLLVDTENEKINLVDMEKGDNSTLSALLYGLTNIQYYRTYADEYYNPVSPEERAQATKDTIDIIVKFMEALENQGFNLDKSKAPSQVVMELFYSTPYKLALMQLMDSKE